MVSALEKLEQTAVATCAWLVVAGRGEEFKEEQSGPCRMVP